MKRKKIEIIFVCDKCGKPQQREESKSNENWNVYKANEKCDCGGTFKMEVKQ